MKGCETGIDCMTSYDFDSCCVGDGRSGDSYHNHESDRDDASEYDPDFCAPDMWNKSKIMT